MKRILFSLLLIACLFVLTARAEAADKVASAPGSTLPPSGSTCSLASPCSLATAISQMLPCDRLRLYGGTYEANIIGLPAGSSSSCRTTVEPIDSAQTVVVRRIEPPLNSLFQGIGSRNFIIDMNNQGTFGASAVQGNNNHFITVKNMEVVRSYGMGISALGDDSIIDNVHVHHQYINSDACASGGGGANSCYPVYVNGARTVIQNSEFDNYVGYCLHLYQNPDQFIVRNNKIHDCYHGIFLGGTGGTANQNLVYNNVIYNQQGYGIWVNGTTNDRVYSNTVYNVGGTGIDLSGSSGAEIKNNLLPAESIVAGSNTQSNNVISGGAGHFVDVANGNFQLVTGSSAIDACLALGAPYNTDISGTSRPQGAGWDCGAYESGKAPPAPSCPTAPAQVVKLGMDEGTGLPQDTSGANNHITALGSGNSWQPSGKYNKAITYGGSAASTITNSNSLWLCQSYTWMAWIKPSNTPTVGVGLIAVTGNRYWLYTSSEGICGTGKPFAGFSLTGADYSACYGTGFTQNVWAHYAATWDGTTIRIYVNGVEVTNAAGTGTIDQPTGIFFLGGNQFNEFFTGDIDEVKGWNYALTGAQIITEMNTPIGPALPPANTVTIKLGAVTKKVDPSISEKVGLAP
jgi:parallel beta-helix repeat protein